MPGLGDIVQKAFYLGVGLAASAGEKAGGKLAELRTQAQKLADDMVAKGEMTTEEARRFVDNMVNQATQPPVEPSPSSPGDSPRRIEILSEDEEQATPETKETKDAAAMRFQVQALQEELRRLKREN